MADQIAGMPRKYVLIGGAAVAGVLGYAYWKNGSAPADTGTVDPGLEAAVDEYESPLGNSGTNSSGNFPGNVDPDTIDTNAKWTQAAVESLETSGWERSTVLTALGKYLAFKGLSANEVTIVMAARAVQGEPPTGGPFPIKDALPDAAVATPDAPRLHHVNTTRTSAILQWSGAANAKTYTVYKSGGSTVKTGVTETSFTVLNLKPNTTYSFSVASVNSAGKRSSKTSNVVTVKTKK